MQYVLVQYVHVRYVLACLACLLLALAGCQMITVPAPTEELTPTEEMTAAEISVPFEAVQIILDFAPESWTPPHSHGGLVLVTVLEGEMTVRDEMTGEETVYAAGEFWTERPGEVHAAGNAGQENARLAAAFLVPEGASLTTVQEGTSTDDLPPGPTSVYRTSMTITESLGNFETIQVINDFAPGAWTPPHWHGGLVMVTVVEGEITVREEETGAETLYGPGESFIEQIGDVLAVGNDGAENARVAVIFLLPEGASLTTAQEGTSSDDLPPGPTPIYRSSMPITTAATEASAEEVAAEEMSADEKIANALSAGPSSIRDGAAVMDWPAEAGGEMTELQPGTNGWTCLPDDPTTPTNDPLCLDATWLAWFQAVLAGEEPEVTSIGFAYMLQGGSVADNDDPSIMEPAAGAEWQIDPPHIMVVSPQPWDMAMHSNVHDSGGPWVMFGGTPVEHVMIPIEMVPLESEAGDDKIANALSAGPSSIRDGAAVMDWPAEAGGEMTELQPGTNGWTCLPDDPTTPTNDPLCLDATWLAWFQAVLAGEEPEVTSIGFAYMLQGGSVADNDDPSIMEPAAGAEWQIDPPHIMILSPYGLDPSLYSVEHDAGGPWVMFGGTPVEHIMVPVVDHEE